MLLAVHTEPVALAVAAAVQVGAELSSLGVAGALQAAEHTVPSLGAWRALPGHVVAGQAGPGTLTGLAAVRAPGPRLAGQGAGGAVVARGAVTGARHGVAPTSVLTGAASLTARAPLTRGTANPLTLPTTVPGLAPTDPGRHTLPVTTALRTVRLALHILRLSVSRATQPVGHSPGDIVLPPPGLHGVDVVRADEGRGQTQRVLLDLD